MGGGGQFLDFIGGTQMLCGGHGAHGGPPVPPTTENPVSPSKTFARRWEKFLSKRRQFKEYDSRQGKLFFWEHSAHWIDKPEYF